MMRPILHISNRLWQKKRKVEDLTCLFAESAMGEKRINGSSFLRRAGRGKPSEEIARYQKASGSPPAEYLVHKPR